MKLPLAFVFVLLCLGCSSVDRQSARSAPSSRCVTLPRFDVQGVVYGDGVTLAEARLIGETYFRIVVGSCGMADVPQDRGSLWCTQLWGGIAGSDSGLLWLAKDGNSILFDPPRGWEGSSQKRWLDRQGIAYEQAH